MGLGIGMHMGVPRFEKPGGEIVKDGLVLYDRFTSSEQTYPSQGSAEFDGSSDYIESEPIVLSSDYTLGAWVYSDGDTSYMILGGGDFSLGNDHKGYWGYFSTSIRVRHDAETIGYSVTYTLPQNEWFYISSVRNGTNVKAYVNGSEVHSSTDSTIEDFTIRTFGYSYAGSYYLDGNLTNVAIWNRALSSDEINSVMWKSYATLDAGEKDGLQAWYALDDIDGTNVPDSSGNGYDGTAN